MRTNEHLGFAWRSHQPGFDSSDVLASQTARDSDGARRAEQGADDRGAPEPAPPEDGLGLRLGAAATFATTEHFNLQSARALTVSEANGRASIYLAALSGNLIALGLIGQVSRLGGAFHAFALVLLPTSAFIGVVTFLRLVQSSIEEIAYAHRIGLLRSFYLRVSPELEPYLVVVHGTRSAAPLNEERLALSAWQMTLTVAGMIAVVNSVVMGSCAGLVLAAAGVHSLAIPVAAAAVIGAGSFWMHERHHRRASDAYCPEAVDRAAILIPAAQQADAAWNGEPGP